ncbi:SDR family NAD(P)-dependent oxidoreductase [Oceanimonas doudoroffii]|uniref:3-oxoacyl-ACP reductase n=1 Tax=Oceanimonas doudoroffii TaxID=84158 RepID=A0A233RIH6_9GAMM|nr:SDR family NAD(P)-dependent oxidoreductase [Oceanimonas doudoroffii]OXY83189.1 3-oxoacyl-ACP reductase [Oceanimonas doudoroffii]
MARLDGKVAIVSGAGSMGPGWGNGKATAVLFAREGAKVFALDRNRAAAEETCAIIREEGGIAEPYVVDVTQEEQVKLAVSACIEAFGRVDILHNNVGILKPGGAEDTLVEDWDLLIEVNMKSVFLTCKHVLPHMVAQGEGSIINVSSISGFRNLGAAYLGYNTSKGSIVSFTRNLAAEYADRNIRANSILPGIIETPMAKDAVIQTSGQSETDLDFDAIAKQRAARIPMKRVGTAWDIAKSALFFASDGSAYVTGTEMIVDGGLTVVG